MRIGILPSATKPDSMQYIEPIAAFLSAKDVDVYVDDECSDSYGLPKIESDTKIDILITLGGDGTLLYFRKKYSHMPNVIFTAVNLGSLGFMADVRVDEIEIYLEDLVEKKYVVEERVIIEAKTPDNQLHQAVNDVVLHRGALPNMIQLKVTINGDHFNTFLADGIIQATPTGSSAYSLASGGPLMHPKLLAFVLTMISAHTLTNRPFVVPEDSIVKIEFLSDDDDSIDVAMDGINTYKLKSGESVELRTASNRFRFINYNRGNFYKIVRTKLNWKGKNKT